MKVAVIIPSYRGVRFIAETVESILSSSYSDFCVYVSDDNSDDCTFEVLSALQSKYFDKLKITKNSSSRGISSNTQSAFLAACSDGFDILMLCGHDDLFYPSKIHSVVDYFKANTETTVCYHDLDIIDESGSKFMSWSDTHFLKEGGAWTLLVWGCYTCACSVSIKVSNFATLSFSNYLGPCSDIGFIFDAAKQGGIGRVPNILGAYRRHPQNITKKIRQNIDVFSMKFCIWVMEKYPEMKYEALLFLYWQILKTLYNCNRLFLFFLYPIVTFLWVVFLKAVKRRVD